MAKRRPEWLGPDQGLISFGPKIGSLWVQYGSIWRVNRSDQTHTTLFRICDMQKQREEFASATVPIENFWKEWREYHG